MQATDKFNMTNQQVDVIIDLFAKSTQPQLVNANHILTILEMSTQHLIEECLDMGNTLVGFVRVDWENVNKTKKMKIVDDVFTVSDGRIIKIKKRLKLGRVCDVDRGFALDPTTHDVLLQPIDMIRFINVKQEYAANKINSHYKRQFTNTKLPVAPNKIAQDGIDSKETEQQKLIERDTKKLIKLKKQRDALKSKADNLAFQVKVCIENNSKTSEYFMETYNENIEYSKSIQDFSKLKVCSCTKPDADQLKPIEDKITNLINKLRVSKTRIDTDKMYDEIAAEILNICGPTYSMKGVKIDIDNKPVKIYVKACDCHVAAADRAFAKLRKMATIERNAKRRVYEAIANYRKAKAALDKSILDLNECEEMIRELKCKLIID